MPDEEALRRGSLNLCREESNKICTPPHAFSERHSFGESFSDASFHARAVRRDQARAARKLAEKRSRDKTRAGTFPVLIRAVAVRELRVLVLDDDWGLTQKRLRRLPPKEQRRNPESRRTAEAIRGELAATHVHAVTAFFISRSVCQRWLTPVGTDSLPQVSRVRRRGAVRFLFWWLFLHLQSTFWTTRLNRS